MKTSNFLILNDTYLFKVDAENLFKELDADRPRYFHFRGTCYKKKYKIFNIYFLEKIKSFSVPVSEYKEIVEKTIKYRT